MKKMPYIWMLLAALQILFFAAPASANPDTFRNTTLKVSTLNLKWFGVAGFMWNEPEAEYRIENIKRFIDEALPDSDVIVFTEIVKTQPLMDIMADRMDCVTYVGVWRRHQHVVICYDKDKYRSEKYDNDYIIEEVDLGSGGQRPAAQAKICHKFGSCFLQVIGVHLAAGPNTDKRTEQIRYINENLQKQQRMLPTVITGDFNSYIKEQTGGTEDNIDIFERILSTGTRRFKSVTRHIFTYRHGENVRAYDHVIASSDIRVRSTEGYEACAKSPDLRKTFIPFYSFRRYFTDHCPVTAEIEVRNR